MKRNSIIVAVTVLILGLILSLTGFSMLVKDQKVPVKVLIFPKFEIGEMAGDFPGEAQCFFEEYVSGGDVYEIDGCPDANRLYYKDGAALILLGEGKVSAALTAAAVLSDERFDFSDAYILSVGCGGAAEGYGILGDVFVISDTVDYDLGHHADPREMSNHTDTTWFHDESFDSSALVRMDESLTDHVFELVENVQLETTEKTTDFLRKEYSGEAWADRGPKVMRGASVTGDNYWKGDYDHQNALLIAGTYGCRDPYAIADMEDISVGLTVKRSGMLERLIILRVGVNMDTFASGVTPEMLWGTGAGDSLAENTMESVDIFETGMHNCFAVGKVVIDAILNGDF